MFGKFLPFSSGIFLNSRDNTRCFWISFDLHVWLGELWRKRGNELRRSFSRQFLWIRAGSHTAVESSPCLLYSLAWPRGLAPSDKLKTHTHKNKLAIVFYTGVLSVMSSGWDSALLSFPASVDRILSQDFKDVSFSLETDIWPQV